MKIRKAAAVPRPFACSLFSLLARETAFEVRVVPLGEGNCDRRARAVRSEQRIRKSSRREHALGGAAVAPNEAPKIAETVAGEPQPVCAFLEEQIDGFVVSRRCSRGHGRYDRR